MRFYLRMTLNELKKGEEGEIIGYQSNSLPSKFLDMGLLPGCYVKICRRGLLNCTLYLECEGCTMIMRSQEAKNILIRTF